MRVELTVQDGRSRAQLLQEETSWMDAVLGRREEASVPTALPAGEDTAVPQKNTKTKKQAA